MSHDRDVFDDWLVLNYLLVADDLLGFMFKLGISMKLLVDIFWVWFVTVDHC